MQQTVAVMRIRKHPCTATVDGHKCGSIWAAVTMRGRKRVGPVRCYMCRATLDGVKQLDLSLHGGTLLGPKESTNAAHTTNR